jgi:hypothetical protein
MARIVVLCEGDTEELAVRHFIQRQWEAEGRSRVGVKSINLRGKLQDIGSKGRLLLEEPEVVAVFTLIDLYRMDRVKHLAADCLNDKVERIREWLRAQVHHRRSAAFVPHVCVHETEAWILAEGAALAKRLRDPSIQPDPDAEVKNFGNPPSKRLNQLVLSRRSGDRYHKIIDGRPLFADLRFDAVYKACRYFRAFYDDLKAMATN